MRGGCGGAQLGSQAFNAWLGDLGGGQDGMAVTPLSPARSSRGVDRGEGSISRGGGGDGGGEEQAPWQWTWARWRGVGR